MKRMFILLGLYFFVLSGFIFGQLREHVAIVEPVYDSETLEGFSRWAKVFADRGQEQWEQFFLYHAGDLGSKAHGSGWVYVTHIWNAIINNE
jgi:hypothetical protein